MTQVLLVSHLIDVETELQDGQELAQGAQARFQTRQSGSRGWTINTIYIYMVAVKLRMLTTSE